MNNASGDFFDMQRYTSKRRALPNTSDMRRQNGPVKITKVGTVRKTKEQRKAWWNSLTQTERAAYVEKREHTRDVPERKELDIPPLTLDEMKAINDRMRHLGLESHIVLPDDDHIQNQIVHELNWI